MNKTEKELLKATRQRSKSKRESPWRYQIRLVGAVNNLSDRAFDKLSAGAQEWANAAVTAMIEFPDFSLRRAPKSLVKEHLEKIHCDVLKEAPVIISEFVRGKNGVYALYNRDKLYYVGLAKSLLTRLLGHLVDRHKDKWDRFSVYLTGPEHRKDLETLLIHIARPPGCGNRGNFVGSDNLSRRVKANFKRKQKEREVELFP